MSWREGNPPHLKKEKKKNERKKERKGSTDMHELSAYTEWEKVVYSLEINEASKCFLRRLHCVERA